MPKFDLGETIDLGEVATLLTIVKETRDYPPLKPITDAAMRVLLDFAQTTSEELDKVKMIDAEEAKARSVEETAARQEEINRAAEENLQKAEEEADARRKADALAKAQAQTPLKGDPNIMGQHPKVVDGVIVGDGTELRDDLADEQDRRELKPITLEGKELNNPDPPPADRPKPIESGQPTSQTEVNRRGPPTRRL